MKRIEPAPLSLEALVVAACAAFVGWAAAHLLALPFRRSRTRARAHPAQ